MDFPRQWRHPARASACRKFDLTGGAFAALQSKLERVFQPLGEARVSALYLRVSTNEQTTENQERELRAVASRMGCEVTKVYSDQGISGAKGRDKRPQFDALCRDATQRRFDIVMAWSVDRLGRSLQDLIGFLSELHTLHVDLYLHQQRLDTTTPSGRAMFQMLGVFAEFERARSGFVLDLRERGRMAQSSVGRRFRRRQKRPFAENWPVVAAFAARRRCCALEWEQWRECAQRRGNLPQCPISPDPSSSLETTNPQTD